MKTSDFPSCSRTYATLCIYGGVLNPADVDMVLRTKATRSHRKGDNIGIGGRVKLAKIGGWFMTSKDEIISNDLQAHLNYLLDKVSTRYSLLKEVTAIESTVIMCFWESSSGNGGPVLSSGLLRRLADLDLELSFDIWFQPS